VAAECERAGTQAIAVPTDVRDEGAVFRLAERAETTFGGIDVWVNDAGVFLMGKLEQVPSDSFRQVIETNFFGTVNGARAAIPRLRARRGVLINVSSMASILGLPYGAAYVSSKWGVRGLSECLRQELRDEGIDVVTILPASIDTPLFEHAANYTGRGIRAMDPVYEARSVARAIIAAARRPRAEVLVGSSAKVARVLRSLLPTALFERGAARQADRKHLTTQPAGDTAGNLTAPQPPHAVSGGWRKDRGRAPVAWKAVAALGAALLPTVWLMKRRRSHGLLWRWS
jgi:NAD(P)-dependent dehydrogenase (short-subunit alcohol dehydrogenase family)